MELDEFKTLWKLKTETEDLPPNEKETLKPSNMNITETISKLNEKTLRLANINQTTINILFGIIAMAIFIHLLLPPELDSLKTSIPAFVIFGLFGAGGLWLSNESKKIFDSSPSSDLRSSITAIIKKWNRWYTISNIFVILFLPFVFYFSLSIVLVPLNLALSFETQIWIVVIASVLNLIFSHWYYSRIFTSKIKTLKEHLKELDQ